MDESVLNDFISELGQASYPADFLQKYEPVECLASSRLGETLLVKDSANTFYVAKCYENNVRLSETSEADILKRLHYHGLPVFVDEYRSETMLCVVREYAPGLALSEIKKPMSQPQIIGIALQLCDILSYLHAQTPPVIHRDIKPQNIVLGENGQIMLIDFGISRVYDENAKSDTVHFGTQDFAPPEQYGFSQTDNRADIFSLGVVLTWLLSGQTDVKKLSVKNKRLERIVKKCAAFAPNDRYKSAARVRRALKNADGHIQKTALRAVAAAGVLFAAMLGGFALGRFTELRPALFYDNSAAYFSEPIVEKAVRLQLGKAETEPIKAEELDAVTELYIYADQAAKTRDDFNTLRSDVNSGTVATGGETLRSLSDIRKLKNLKRLSVGDGGFSDISALEDARNLTALEFIKCPISDISAVGSMSGLEHFLIDECDRITDISTLAGCKKLSEVLLCGCRADDFSVLAQLGDLQCLHVQDVDPYLVLPHVQGKSIRQLRLGFRLLKSASDLSGINGLEELELDQMKLKSLDGIDSLPSLTQITLTGMPDIDLAPLNALPYLQKVRLSADMKNTADAMENVHFEISYQ